MKEIRDRASFLEFFPKRIHSFLWNSVSFNRDNYLKQQNNLQIFSSRTLILLFPSQNINFSSPFLRIFVVFDIVISMDLIHNLYRKIKIVFQNERKEIWLAKNIYDGQLCIIKLQYHTNDNKKSNARTVLHQGKFLQNMLGYTGIPFMHWGWKRIGDGYCYPHCRETRENSVRTVQRARKEVLHQDCMHDRHRSNKNGLTHGNLKPSSIQFGIGKKCTQLFFNDLIDSDLYIKKGKHIKQKQSIRRGKINQFLSIDRLQGYGGSRRDDIESIIYMLLFFLKGSLPWSKYFDKAIFKKTHTSYEQAQTQEQTIKFNQNLTKQLELAFNQSLNQLLKKISQTKIQQICEGVPNGLKKMLQDCRATQFDQRPDYNSYIRNLQKILNQNGYENDTIFDWMTPTSARLIMKKNQYKQFSLKLRNEKVILNQCYEPFEDKVHLS